MGRHKKTVIISDPDTHTTTVEGVEDAPKSPSTGEALDSLERERAEAAEEAEESKPKKRRKKRKVAEEEEPEPSPFSFTMEVPPVVRFASDKVLDIALSVLPNPMPWKDMERSGFAITSNMMLQKHGEKVSQWMPEICFGVVVLGLLFSRMKKPAESAPAPGDAQG